MKVNLWFWSRLFWKLHEHIEVLLLHHKSLHLKCKRKLYHWTYFILLVLFGWIIFFFVLMWFRIFFKKRNTRTVIMPLEFRETEDKSIADNGKFLRYFKWFMDVTVQFKRQLKKGYRNQFKNPIIWKMCF